MSELSDLPKDFIEKMKVHIQEHTQAPANVVQRYATRFDGTDPIEEMIVRLMARISIECDLTLRSAAVKAKEKGVSQTELGYLLVEDLHRLANELKQTIDEFYIEMMKDQQKH